MLIRCANYNGLARCTLALVSRVSLGAALFPLLSYSCTWSRPAVHDAVLRRSFQLAIGAVAQRVAAAQAAALQEQQGGPTSATPRCVRPHPPPPSVNPMSASVAGREKRTPPRCGSLAAVGAPSSAPASGLDCAPACAPGRLAEVDLKAGTPMFGTAAAMPTQPLV